MVSVQDNHQSVPGSIPKFFSHSNQVYIILFIISLAIAIRTGIGDIFFSQKKKKLKIIV